MALRVLRSSNRRAEPQSNPHATDCTCRGVQRLSKACLRFVRARRPAPAPGVRQRSGLPCCRFANALANTCEALGRGQGARCFDATELDRSVAAAVLLACRPPPAHARPPARRVLSGTTAQVAIKALRGNINDSRSDSDDDEPAPTKKTQ